MNQPHATLYLDVIAGPPLSDGSTVVRIGAEGRAVLGRSAASDTRLVDPSVSRRHAQVSRAGDDWLIQDLGSRHGTLVNGSSLDLETPIPLRAGDQVQVGPWTFRVRHKSTTVAGMTAADDRHDSSKRVEAVPESELRRLAQQRLEALIECSGQINAAANEQELARAVTAAAVEGTGCPRAVLVRRIGQEDELELLGHAGPPGELPERVLISRSLINEASAGRAARLSADAPLPDHGQSIVSLGIHWAICAPVTLGASVEALLYLDARGGEQRVEGDAAAYCQALARICSLALANLKRQELERHRELAEHDLAAARQAQRLIMPPPSDDVGAIRYAFESRPGRVVAGDLLDVVPLGAGKTALFLGDVTGKGVGAAITMASVQTHLRVALRAVDDPGGVVRDVNAALVGRLPPGRFVTLWLGVFDADAEEIQTVDAGHGHLLVRRPHGPPTPVESDGGIPLGLDESYPYATERLALPPASRLTVFSDGLIEQPDPRGRLFGIARVIEALTPSTSPADDVRALSEAVRGFAQTDRLADDYTVASIERLR